MNEIDQVANSFLYASVQNSSNPLARTDKNNETSKVKKGAFSRMVKEASEEESVNFSTIGLPPEVQGLSFDETVVWLKDAVDKAGNDLADKDTPENIQAFKKSIKDFMTFVVANNYQVHYRKKPGFRDVRSQQVFSKFNDIPSPRDPRVTVSIINQKLDSLVYDMLTTQKKNGNMDRLARINEIKGLIVDLIS